MNSNMAHDCLFAAAAAAWPSQVESLSQQVKQLEDTLRLTTKEYILGGCVAPASRRCCSTATGLLYFEHRRGSAACSCTFLLAFYLYDNSQQVTKGRTKLSPSNQASSYTAVKMGPHEIAYMRPYVVCSIGEQACAACLACPAARREKQDAQAAAAAAQAQMVADVAAARAELAAAQRQARADVERAAASADSKMREYVDKFREQVRACAEVWQVLKCSSSDRRRWAAVLCALCAAWRSATKLLSCPPTYTHMRPKQPADSHRCYVLKVA